MESNESVVMEDLSKPINVAIVDFDASSSDEEQEEEIEMQVVQQAPEVTEPEDHNSTFTVGNDVQQDQKNGKDNYHEVVSSPEEISAIVRNIVVEKFSPTKEEGVKPPGSWLKKAEVIETVSSSDPEPVSSSSCDPCDTTETSLSSGMVTPILTNPAIDDHVQTVVSSSSSVDTSASGVVTPESEPSSSTSSSGSSPIFVGSEVNYKTDNISSWKRGKILTVNVNDVNGNFVVIRDKSNGTQHTISDTRKFIRSGRHSVEALNRLDTPRRPDQSFIKSKQKYVALDVQSHSKIVATCNQESSSGDIKRRSWTKPPPSLHAKANAESLAEFVSKTPPKVIDKKFTFPPPPIVDLSQLKDKIPGDLSHPRMECDQSNTEDGPVKVQEQNPLSSSIDRSKEKEILNAVQSIDIDELKNHVIQDLELEMSRSRCSATTQEKERKKTNTGIIKEVEHLHPFPSQMSRTQSPAPNLKTVDEYYEGNVTEENSPRVKSPCNLPTIEEECLEDKHDQSNINIEDLEINDSFHPGSCSSPEPDPRMSKYSARSKEISVTTLNDLMAVFGVEKQFILTLLDQTSFQEKFSSCIMTLPLKEFTEDNLASRIFKKTISVMTQQQLDQMIVKITDSFLPLASTEEGHTIILSLLSSSNKSNQEQLSNVLLDKKTLIGLLKTGTGTLVAQRCLAHVNADKLDDFLGDIVEYLLRVFRRVQLMPSQFLGFVDYLVSRIGHKEAMFLLLDEVVSQDSLAYLAMHPIGHWVLQTVLKTKQDHCLRMIVRWIIKNLGLVLFNISSGALAISVIERLLEKVNEEDTSVIWNHLLKSMIISLLEEGENTQDPLKSEVSVNVEVVFEKLFEDSIADISEAEKKRPMLVRAAMDSVGHRFVVELIPLLIHLQPFAKDSISATFNDFESDLKKNQYGLIIVNCLRGNM